MEIKDWVKAARAHKGLTQDQLGEALGRTKSNVSGWEQGLHEPSYSQIRAISAVTGHAMPNGARELFSEALLKRLLALDEPAIRRLEEELCIRFQVGMSEAEPSFTTTTAPKSAARKSSPGRSVPVPRRGQRPPKAA